MECNGIRARYKNGLKQVFDENPDILCIQEVKASMDKIPESLKNLETYNLLLNSNDNPAYAGVALFTNKKPVSTDGFPDSEETGRVLQADYGNFKLYNIYFPSGAGSADGLEYKFNFYDRFLKTMAKECNENIIVCGDFNIAHQEIDLPNPKAASKFAGFLPEERAFIDKLQELGFTDSFREFNSEPHNYTWWSYGRKCRENNIGMRLDYFFVSESLKENITDAKIRNDITGSDHCPIELDINI
jgi:exodeoxyribonuclease III